MTDTAVVPASETTSTTSTENDQLPIIAHQGGLELLDAKWDLNSGRTVKFRLVNNGQPLIVHPFLQFVRRRGNRMGTRFMVAMTRVGDERSFFQGEMMLLGGGNPLGQGMWVRFWLDDEADSHPFAGCMGRHRDNPGDMFMAAFVELDDDDHPINQVKRDRVERSGPRLGPNCKWAVARCNDNLFAQWLSETVVMPDGNTRPVEWWLTPKKDRIARWMRWLCGMVESRKNFDDNPVAENLFHEKIRRPYAEWRSTSED